VLERARNVIKVVVENGNSWPDLGVWRMLLPAWLVDASPAEQATEEAERWLIWWRSLRPPEQRAAADAAGSSLADWLYWLHPNQRQWFWWHARVVTEVVARIKIATV